jgi:hypothetical protein
MKLAKCPCGKTPESLYIEGDGRASRWAMADGNCCGIWHIVFGRNNSEIDSDECIALAEKAWKEAPRGDSEVRYNSEDRLIATIARLEAEIALARDRANALGDKIKAAATIMTGNIVSDQVDWMGDASAIRIKYASDLTANRIKSQAFDMALWVRDEADTTAGRLIREIVRLKSLLPKEGEVTT